MTNGTWISLLTRQSRNNAPVGWDEMVVGHDFGLLGIAEIQQWVREQGFQGPSCLRLAALEGDLLARFEEMLWAACAECTGKVPRPGGNRWAKAQDRWRVALLKDALESPLSPEALAVAVESIYERVGCPEDMLELWQRHSPWQKRPGSADRTAIARFLRRCEDDFVTAV
jgi:hypothetical protein